MPTERRLGPLHPRELSADQASLYEAITRGDRAATPGHPLTDGDGRLTGPFDAMLRSPAVGNALQGLGSALRFATALSPRAREIAILAVAAHEASAFETYAHEAVGRAAGLTEDELSALRNRLEPDFTDPVENAVLATVRQALTAGDLSDEQYRHATSTLGETSLFELLTLVGYYRTLALQMRVFRIGGPET